MIVYRHNNNIKKLCLIVQFKNFNYIKVKNIHIVIELEKERKTVITINRQSTENNNKW